ncbi:MAG: alpha/beta hydrolase [Pedobacter sp.]|nr:MAG: alpha/beta hydrolase [Pedobacter sp.]
MRNFSIFKQSLGAGILIIFLCLGFACKKENPVPVNPVITLAAQEMKDLSYGSDPLQKLDVYLPANRDAKTKIVVFVHGGSFIGGDKLDYEGVVRELYREQIAVININYRLVDDAGLYQNPILRKDSPVKVKDQVADLAKALDFIWSKLGEWKLNDQKVALIGHSAGATLSLLYASHENSPNRIKAVVNLAGALDQTFTDIPQYQQVLPPYVLEAAHRFTGYPVNLENLAYFKEISPLYQVNPNRKIPTLNIFPELNDVMGLPKQGRATFDAYTQSLNQQGIPNKFVLIPGANHEFFGKFDLVLKETIAYLKIHLDGA